MKPILSLEVLLTSRCLDIAKFLALAILLARGNRMCAMLVCCVKLNLEGLDPVHFGRVGLAGLSLIFEILRLFFSLLFPQISSSLVTFKLHFFSVTLLLLPPTLLNLST